jgi:hypothetical protein
MCTATRADWFVTDEACFFCASPLGSERLVHWEGASGITLHPACAAKLGRHLIADAREAEMSSGAGKWRQRVERTFLASLASAGESHHAR